MADTTQAATRRTHGLRDEVAFWRSLRDRTNPNQQLVDLFQERLAHERGFQPYLDELVDLPAGAIVRVLDVGSGPLSQVGTASDRYRIEITAVDPLAHTYRKELALEQRGVVTRRGTGETLIHDFPPRVFDLVFCRNALDHTSEPLLAIRQMVRVCKAAGAVFLSHSTDEGRKQRYRGLHQWDFSPREDGDLVISTPGKPPVSLRQELRGTATVQATMTGVSATGTRSPPHGWHTAVVRPTRRSLI